MCKISIYLAQVGGKLIFSEKSLLINRTTYSLNTYFRSARVVLQSPEIAHQIKKEHRILAPRSQSSPLF